MYSSAKAQIARLVEALFAFSLDGLHSAASAVTAVDLAFDPPLDKLVIPIPP
jgi:hypothetical protein